MGQTLHILILDDEEAIGKGIKIILDKMHYATTCSSVPSEALGLLEKNHFDIMFLDLKLPEMDGLTFMSIIKKKYPELEVIMISGYGDVPDVIEAMRLGAIDFLRKPFSYVDIQLSIKRTSKFIEINQKLSKSESITRKVLSIKGKTSKLKMVFVSEEMKQIIRLIEIVSTVDGVPILVSGESGTGKELIAETIFRLSNRTDKPFITANCAAIPNDLFESEFFGHIKGAFTGAISDQPGLFEVASGGFLFLDEIGEIDIRQQSKLLRALEALEIKRIGGQSNIKVDTRIIAATNQDLEELVQEKKFRLDLFHRLSVFVIHIPPLRKRRSDIIPLFEHFIRIISKRSNSNIPEYSQELERVLLSYDFPGNIRELKNMTERAIIISRGEPLGLKHFYFPGKSLIKLSKEKFHKIETNFNLDDIEKDTIQRALQETKDNKLQAAKLLNITPQSLRRRIEKYKIIT